MKHFMIKHKGIVFFRPYFCGDAWLESGYVQTNMGYGVFPIEKNIIVMCSEISKMASWLILNCSRALRMNAAGAAGGELFARDDENDPMT